MSDRLPLPMEGDSGRAGVERASATPARRHPRKGAAPHAAAGAATARSLRELEVWMLGAITGSDADAEEAHAVLRPGQRQSARERLEVYRSGYTGRLVECLRDDYPVLTQTLGDDAFDALAEAYVARHPSTLPNLNPFGRHMAAFVREAPVAELAEVRDFASDLAALEWSLVEVLHAGEPPGLDLGAIQGLAPDAWSSARLERAEAVRVLRFAYPVNGYYQAWRTATGEPGVPAPAPTATAVYRQGLTLWRLDLTPAMANLLEALFAGTPLGVALEALGAGLADAEEIAEAERNVMAWFQAWVRAGFFAGIAVPRG